MNRFGTGFLIGNIVGMASVLLTTNKHSNKSIAKSTKQAIEKVGEIAQDIVAMYK